MKGHRMEKSEFRGDLLGTVEPGRLPGGGGYGAGSYRMYVV